MKGVELSLITKKPLEMNGKGLGDIRIQTKTGQMKSFFWPILDTSFSAAVRPGSPWGLQLEQGPGVVVQEAQCFVFYALGAVSLLKELWALSWHHVSELKTDSTLAV